MASTADASQRRAKNEQAIKRRIAQLAGARIQDLEVAVDANRIVITGRALSYYVKQLALQGTIDVMGADCKLSIELNIQVEFRARKSELDRKQP